MSQHNATTHWQRDGAPFCDGEYSRAHWWRFAGGVEVAATASPAVVPPPFSVAENVDPEAAFVAALSACHLLFFLSIAAKQKYVVDSYTDNAAGEMGKNEDGDIAVLRVTLRPRIVFCGDKKPDKKQIQKIHHLAHKNCFLANSVKTKISVESVD